MGRFEDRVIMVTGSTTGIGAAIARACASQGAHVLVHGRDAQRARETVESLERDGDYFVGDLADPRTCEELVAAAVERFGRLDGIVNNAALTTRSELESTDPETFDRLMAVNLRAPLLLIRAALPHLMAADDGSVVNIGSVNAYCGEENLLAYSISKGGLMTLTRNLAQALGSKGVRVNQLNVGWTLTPNEAELFEAAGYPSDWHRHVNERYAPSGSLLTPEQVARQVVHWLSSDSYPISGSVLELEQYPIIGRPGNDERLVE